MSMMDCPECWNVLCSCGYEWATHSPARLEAMIHRLEILRDIRTAWPDMSQEKTYAFMKEQLKEEKAKTNE